MKGFQSYVVILRAHSIVYLKPIKFGPWVFSTEEKARAFVYRLFALSLVEWAQRRRLEWPEGCVDPPNNAKRLGLLRDYRMLCQLHDYYHAEKKETGLNYWTWKIKPVRCDDDPEKAAAEFIRNMGSEFTNF